MELSIFGLVTLDKTQDFYLSLSPLQLSFKHKGSMFTRSHIEHFLSQPLLVHVRSPQHI